MMKFAMNMNVTTIVMGAAILDLAGLECPASLPAEATILAAHVTHFDNILIKLLMKFVWAMFW